MGTHYLTTKQELYVIKMTQKDFIAVNAMNPTVKINLSKCRYEITASSQTILYMQRYLYDIFT